MCKVSRRRVEEARAGVVEPTVSSRLFFAGAQKKEPIHGEIKAVD